MNGQRRRRRRDRRRNGVLGAAVAITLLVPVGCSNGKSAPTVNSLITSGIAAIGKADYMTARRLFNQVLVRQPHNVYAHYNLGLIDQKLGLSAPALDQYALALTADPNFTSALFNQAVIYSQTDPPLAVATYRRILRIRPDSASAHLNLGLLEMNQGQAAAGVADLAAAITQMPSLVSRLTKRQHRLVTNYLVSGSH